MFDWIRSHYALSMQRLLEIGDCEQSTSMLLTEHFDFIAAANVRFFSASIFNFQIKIAVMIICRIPIVLFFFRIF